MNSNIVEIIHSLIAPKNNIDKFVAKHNVIYAIKDVENHQKCMVDACKFGYLKLVKLLVKRINKLFANCRSKGFSKRKLKIYKQFTFADALENACKNNRENIVKYLIKFTNISSKIVREAYKNGNKHIIDMIWRGGPHSIAFLGACEGNHTELAKSVYAIGTLVEAAFFASKNHNLELLEFIINKNECPIPYAFYGACAGGHLDIMKSVFDGSFIIDWDHALTIAAAHGNLNAVKMAEENGATKINSALYEAIYENKNEVAEYFMGKPNISLKMVASAAIATSNIKLLDRICEMGFKEWSSVYNTFVKDEETALYLINKGVEINLETAIYISSLKLAKKCKEDVSSHLSDFGICQSMWMIEKLI